MEIEEFVALAVNTHAAAVPVSHHGPGPVVPPGERSGLVSALAWIAASAIVTAHHAGYGMDAIPRYDLQRGWDGFHLARRVPRPGSSPVVVGAIDITSDDAPAIVMAGEPRPITLGAVLLSDPAPAIATMVERVRPPDPLGATGHQPSWAQQQRVYPLMFRAATELVLAYPRLIVARELFVDAGTIGGAYHPLFLHSDGAGPHLTYDWLLIQWDERCVFLHTNGGQVIYERAPGVWATSSHGLAGHSLPAIKRRITGWLQLDAHEPS